MEQSVRVWKKYGPWLLLALLAVSLIPILLLARYNWPSADDYSYALLPHEAMLDGECLLSGTWHAMWSYYKGWQGTFTAIGMMTLTPLTFSEYLYWLTPVVMLTSLCAGTFKLADTLARRALGGSWRQTVFLAVPLLVLSIQFVASPKDTFYWWNGAVYYTFTYGIMLLMVERLVALKLAQNRRQTLWAVIPGTLCALLVGGSNYVSALLGTLLAGLFLLWFLWQDRKKFLPALIPTVVVAAAFLVSVAAPGNQVRQGLATPPIGAVDAVFRSIEQAWADLLEWFSWPVLLGFLLMIPLLWGLSGKTSFRFRLPPLFTVFSFLLFAAQNAPHFYALGVAGPERLRSIVSYSFFWLVTANLWYWLGWLRRAVLPRLSGTGEVPRLLWAAVPVLLVLLVFTTVHYRYYDESTAGRAMDVLADGSAQHYWQQQAARLEQYWDPDVTDVRVEPLDVSWKLHDLLYNGDIHEDPEVWLNQALANFYHKDSVALTPLILEGGLNLWKASNFTSEPLL